MANAGFRLYAYSCIQNCFLCQFGISLNAILYINYHLIKEFSLELIMTRMDKTLIIAIISVNRKIYESPQAVEGSQEEEEVLIMNACLFVYNVQISILVYNGKLILNYKINNAYKFVMNDVIIQNMRNVKMEIMIHKMSFINVNCKISFGMQYFYENVIIQIFQIMKLENVQKEILTMIINLLRRIIKPNLILGIQNQSQLVINVAMVDLIIITNYVMKGIKLELMDVQACAQLKISETIKIILSNQCFPNTLLQLTYLNHKNSQQYIELSFINYLLLIAFILNYQPKIRVSPLKKFTQIIISFLLQL
ncbi:unnamed protein product [Paramecium pentaurelia]|uniref:Uncharacterized protein n=1 Tax=Paramecium pentaurelia TaxID=43138 RepID=A0A8S1YLU0_9CILI|nr:unnamed protein product [Paramecium pentaurelia]